MKLTGTVAELTNRGGKTDFLLHTTTGQDTRIQIASDLAKTISNGDLVEVNGDMPPDPPFLANSISRLTPAVAKTLPWKWIAIGVAACLIVIVAIVLMTGSGDTWTIAVTDVSGPAVAGVDIRVTGKTNTALQTVTTDSSGQAAFKDLKADTYTAVGPGGAKVSIQFDGKSSKTSALKVHSPFMWTVKATVGGVASSGQTVTLSGPTSDSGTTGSTGTYVFNNLKPGTYTAKDGTTSISVVIDGKTAPAQGILNLPARPRFPIPVGRVPLEAAPSRLQQ